MPGQVSGVPVATSTPSLRDWHEADPFNAWWGAPAGIATFAAVTARIYGFGLPTSARAMLIGIPVGCPPPLVHGWLLQRKAR